jgi:hypothetical protein
MFTFEGLADWNCDLLDGFQNISSCYAAVYISDQLIRVTKCDLPTNTHSYNSAILDWGPEMTYARSGVRSKNAVAARAFDHR